MPNGQSISGEVPVIQGAKQISSNVCEKEFTLDWNEDVAP